MAAFNSPAHALRYLEGRGLLADHPEGVFMPANVAGWGGSETLAQQAWKILVPLYRGTPQRDANGRYVGHLFHLRRP